MAIISMLSFDHLPDVTDIYTSVNSFPNVEDFGGLNFSKTGFTFYSSGSSVMKLGIGSMLGRKCLNVHSLQTGTQNTATAAYNTYLQVNTYGHTATPRTGKWIWGARMLFTELYNNNPQLFNILHTTTVGGTWIAANTNLARLSTQNNTAHYVELVVNWDTKNISLYVNDILHYSVTPSTLGDVLCYMGQTQVDWDAGAGYYYAQFLKYNNPASKVGYTDLYFKHVPTAELGAGDRLGSVRVTPVTVNAVIQDPVWSSSDPAKSFLQVINEPVLTNLTNLNVPYLAVGDSSIPIKVRLNDLGYTPQTIYGIQVAGFFNPSPGAAPMIDSSFSAAGSTTPVKSSLCAPYFKNLGYGVHEKAPDGTPWTVAKMTAAELSITASSPAAL